ncbi:conjugal transfer protein TraI [Pedobacter panaciterrae]|uniref:conjugal transfer protein TraI n=1 Tax=Pedobacter panaciterrae TaxID=363849 RepID=UPI002597FADB|nr:conjugal transfer protein TraI [uncultured Pedobacter sp.]
MKKWKLITIALMTALLLPITAQKAQAAIPVAILEIIKAGIKKVIKAVDLQIQRQQNKIIWLQNAQKTLENTLSKLKLDEISDWTSRQKQQYQQYFDELHKVKMLISYYQRIRDITDKQVKIVAQYNKAWDVVRRDDHFRPHEIEYMAKVYSGILRETVKNIDQLAMVVNSFRTTMSDAKRLEIINQVADKVDENFTDLRAFNTENALLSLQRSSSEQESALVKKMYGIEN